MPYYEHLLQEMDIILTHDKTSWIGKAIAKFSSKLSHVNERVDHVTVYLGDNKIIESTNGGVRVRETKGYNPHNFVLYIARYNNMTDDFKRVLKEKLLSKVGLKYSYFQLILLLIKKIFNLKTVVDASTNAVVCSELVALAFEEAGKPIMDIPSHEFTPADFFRAPNFTIIRVF